MSEHQTKILVATDGSKASFHAAEWAVHLAGHLRAKLYVLYAVDKDRAIERDTDRDYSPRLAIGPG